MAEMGLLPIAIKATFLYFIALMCQVNATGIPRFLHGRPTGGRLGAPPVPHGVKLPPDQWFPQVLDHFNPQTNATWKQRYFTNDTFYRKGGPIFTMIGGEGTANPVWMVEGTWIEYAKAFNAVCFQLEHRFYGKSHPTTDMSTSNLQYLSSEQALSDLSTFISSMKQKYPGARVITFGGSYPGSLSAWFRLKYPHLCDGAIATSGPLLAQVNFKEYLGVVEAALVSMSGGTACSGNVRAANVALSSMMATQEGRMQIMKMFRLCGAASWLTDARNAMNMFSVLAGNFEGVVQYNRDNRAFEGAKGTNVTIDVLCTIMNQTKNKPVENYAAVNNLLMSAYNQSCQDFSYKDMINELKQTSWNSSAGEGGRQWTYQTCAEFGFYQSSDLKGQPFGNNFPLKFFTAQCSDIFGPQFTADRIAENVRQTNIRYGGRQPPLSRVVLPNGSVDPWHALGAVRDLGPDAVAIFINGTAHCANMYPALTSDPPQLTLARATVQSYIAKWLK